MSLNFRDCHAKIRQVDSQATVGNAVVVQVDIFWSCTSKFQHTEFKLVPLLSVFLVVVNNESLIIDNSHFEIK